MGKGLVGKDNKNNNPLTPILEMTISDPPPLMAGGKIQSIGPDLPPSATGEVCLWALPQRQAPNVVI